MKTIIALLLLSALPVLSEPKDDLIQSVKQLAQSGYTWQRSSTFGTNETIRPGLILGECGNGYIHITSIWGGRTNEALSNRGGVVIKMADGWKTPPEVAGAGFGSSEHQFSRWLTVVKLPEDEIQSFASNSSAVELKNGVYTLQLNEDTAKLMLSQNFGLARGRPQGDVAQASATAKITMTGNRVSRYEVSASGSSLDGRKLSRQWVVTISAVGTTKVVMPEEVERKITRP